VSGSGGVDREVNSPARAEGGASPAPGNDLQTDIFLISPKREPFLPVGPVPDILLSRVLRAEQVARRFVLVDAGEAAGRLQEGVVAAVVADARNLA